MVTKTKHEGTIFSVDTVEPATELLPICKSYEGIDKLLTATDYKSAEAILSCSGYNDTCVNGVSYHPLMAAVHLAFSQHRPLVLSPDMIWLTIVQGIAQHVRNNSEKLRSKLVDHSGKIELSIERTDIFADSPETDWALIADGLAKSLQNHIGDKFDQLAADFSTTTELEKTVCAIAIMDVFEPYFEYAVYCVCGIPSITLEGNPGDWARLREKAKILEFYDLDWWLQALSPLLHQFERASRSDIDLAHWQNIYKLKEAMDGIVSMAGSPIFFPT